MKQLNTLLTLLLAGVFFSTACDTTNSRDEVATVQLQMQVKADNTAAKQFSANQNVQGVVIQQIKLFVEEMELESIQNDSLDFEIENFIVNLPLDGSPLVLTEQEFPAGIYDEFEIEVEKPDDLDVNVTDTDFRDETGSFSIVVKGLYNGVEFTFRSSEDFEIEIELNPALEIRDGEMALLTLSVDVSNWFKGANGEDLDPNDPANTELINSNIELSFEAFEDLFDDEDDDE
jgi:hypothetical protein